MELRLEVIASMDINIARVKISKCGRRKEKRIKTHVSHPRFKIQRTSVVQRSSLYVLYGFTRVRHAVSTRIFHARHRPDTDTALSTRHTTEKGLWVGVSRRTRTVAMSKAGGTGMAGAVGGRAAGAPSFYSTCSLRRTHTTRTRDNMSSRAYGCYSRSVAHETMRHVRSRSGELPLSF